MSANGGTPAAAGDAERLAAELSELATALPERLDIRDDDVDAGLGRLVLTVLELIRAVLEHQAVRRMEGGALNDDEVERLGLALLRLSGRLDEIREVFGLEREDLNIDLGPLGRIV